MAMLKLFDIQKTYQAGNTYVQALKGVSLAFRKSEFVSILGPSGCGKTTLLNIIGGLDRYGSGDLIINDVSTKQFKDGDWDAYRNRSIGFVFQTYNLIGHQTVLSNVEIAMTLSGISPAERKQRATEALNSVQLGDQLHKKPNQLSGGQMQRVAIARALVNNPDIILADEPTGALDTQTSIQIMNILKEVAKTRLVIMVTHNSEMAEAFSTRIIRLLDGEVISDSMPLSPEEFDAAPPVAAPETQAAQEESAPAAAAAASAGDKGKKNKKYVDGKPRKTSMSFFTALNLSFKNLLTKKGRTILTAFAGSIGIIGVSLVLSLSGGMQAQINKMTTESMANFPIQIDSYYYDYNKMLNGMGTATNKMTEFPSEQVIYPYTPNEEYTGVNNITKEFYDHLQAMDKSIYNSIGYGYSMRMNLVKKMGDAVSAVSLSSSRWQELPSNPEYVESLYDVLNMQGRLPAARDEVVIVTDTYNRINSSVLTALGVILDESDPDAIPAITFDNLINTVKIRVVTNDDYYIPVASAPGTFAVPADRGYNAADTVELKIVGILRNKQGLNSSVVSEGLVYHSSLREYMYGKNSTSAILTAQRTNLITDLRTNGSFGSTQADQLANYLLCLQALGYTDPSMPNGTPSSISIYPVDFDKKAEVKKYIDKFNDAQTVAANKIFYQDLMEVISGTMTTMINTISIALTAFAAISLIVSSIMIAIITYVSVIERTKEIGILRSVGARKRDISSVFNAETTIIGFAAGLMGVIIAWLLTIPINAIVRSILQSQGSGIVIDNIAQMSVFIIFGMILLSVALTLIAGFIPSRMAARKDPVIALRTE